MHPAMMTEVASFARCQVVAVLRATSRSMILAILAASGLLFGYCQVLDGAVRQGELRRIATADHLRAVWQCKALRSTAVRRDCLSKLHAPSRGRL